MPTFTTRLRIEKQVDGSNENTWGQVANRVFDLIDQSIAGLLEIPLAATDVPLTATDGQIDQARNMMLKLTGTLTGNVNVIIPPVSKIYVILNDTDGAFTVTVKTAAGVGVVIPQDTIQMVACDGLECGVLSVDEAANAVLLAGLPASTYARKDQGLPTDQIFTKAQGTARVALVISGGNVAVDASLSNCFRLDLTGPVTLQNPTGLPVSGQTIRILTNQNGAGGHTITFESKYKFPGGTAPTMTVAANAVDYLAFEYDATDDIWVGNILQDLQ